MSLFDDLKNDPSQQFQKCSGSNHIMPPSFFNFHIDYEQDFESLHIEKPKRGRPKKDVRLEITVQTRLTREEVSYLKAYAKQYKMSVSEFVRFSLGKCGVLNDS